MPEVCILLNLTLGVVNFQSNWTILFFSFFIAGEIFIISRPLLANLNKYGWAIVPIVCMILYFLVNAIVRTYNPLHTGDIALGEHMENVPNYLVFIATSISAIYIYKTLNNQRLANQVAAFENCFFKFIDYHRENVNELRARDPSSAEERYWEGNQVFTVIY